MEWGPVLRLASAAVIGWITYRSVRRTIASRPVTRDVARPTSFFPLSDLAPSGRLRLASDGFAILASIIVISFVISSPQFFTDMRSALVDGTLTAIGNLAGDLGRQIVGTFIGFLGPEFNPPLALLLIIVLFGSYIRRMVDIVRDHFVVPFFILDGAPDEQALNAADAVLAAEHGDIEQIQQKITMAFGSLPKIPPGVAFPDNRSHVAYLLTCLTKHYPNGLTLGEGLLLVQQSLAASRKVSFHGNPLEPPGFARIGTFVILFILFIFFTPFLPLLFGGSDSVDVLSNGNIAQILGGAPRSWDLSISGVLLYWPHYSHGSEWLTFAINSLQVAILICMIFPMLIYIFGPYAVDQSDRSQGASMWRTAFVVQFIISSIALLSIVCCKVYLANAGILDREDSPNRISVYRADVVIEILMFSLLPFVLFRFWVAAHRLNLQYAGRFIKIISFIGFLLISTTAYTAVSYVCDTTKAAAMTRSAVAAAPAPAPPIAQGRTPLPLAAYSAGALSMALVIAGIAGFALHKRPS